MRSEPHRPNGGSVPRPTESPVRFPKHWKTHLTGKHQLLKKDEPLLDRVRCGCSWWGRNWEVACCILWTLLLLGAGMVWVGVELGTRRTQRTLR